MPIFQIIFHSFYKIDEAKIKEKKKRNNRKKLLGQDHVIFPNTVTLLKLENLNA